MERQDLLLARIGTMNRRRRKEADFILERLVRLVTSAATIRRFTAGSHLKRRRSFTGSAFALAQFRRPSRSDPGFYEQRERNAGAEAIFPMNEGIYYLQLNGKAEGPYTIGQIYDLWAARKINSQTHFARFEEMDKWQPLSELTLKISAPRSAASRVPASEPAPAPAQSKPKSTAGIPPAEEYVPSVVYRRGPRPAAPAANARRIFPLIRRSVLNLTFASAFCICVGAITMFYFLLFFSTTPNTDSSPQALATKQCGVIAGTGLVLMGGILIVARQVTQGLAAFKGEPSLKGSPETARPENQTNRS